MTTDAQILSAQIAAAIQECRVTQLDDFGAALKEALVAALKTNNQSSESTRAALPGRFDGKSKDQDKAADFIRSIEAYFRLASIVSEDKRINLAVSLLDGNASRWTQSWATALDQPIGGREPEFLNQWSKFKTEFLKRFGDPLPESTAYERLRALRQTGSVSDYATAFMSLADRINEYGSSTKYYDFRNGLKPQVREALAAQGSTCPGPKEFDKFVDTAISIDDAQYKSRTSKTRSSSTYSHATTSSATSATQAQQSSTSSSANSGPVPMDLDSANMIPPKGQHLTAEERKRRFDQGLCTYCGKSGHFKDKCPSRFRNHAKSD